ncbi:MAG: Crp/Fnr family transcriptional regulator [Ectothiorhodospiraceae bacterium]|nr:Crp/Fnr family transcriptional regulator [Ectothiorhodospiraceae bacterium]
MTMSAPHPGLQTLNHNWRAELSDAARAALDAHVARVSLGPGEYLYRYGDPAETGFQILRGRIAVNSLSRTGRELLLGELGPGDCLGDLGLVRAGVRVNHAQAISASEVTVLHRSAFQHVADAFPEILVTMNRMLADRFQILFALIQDACLLSLYDRLGRILIRLSLSGRARRTGEATVRIGDCPHEMLGNMVGAVRQSVSRELKKMQVRGLIRVEYRSVVILDYPRMVEEFGQNLDYEPITAAPLGQMDGSALSPGGG